MLQLIVIQTTKEYISLGRGNNELKRIDELLNRRRYKLRRLWRPAVATHPPIAEHQLCRVPMVAPQPPIAETPLSLLLINCSWVRDYGETP